MRMLTRSDCLFFNAKKMTKGSGIMLLCLLRLDMRGNSNNFVLLKA